MSEKSAKPLQEITLGKYAQIRARIGWRGLSSKEYIDRGGALLGAGNHIVNGRFDWSRSDRITLERYEESPEIALQETDLVISKDGTIGRVAYIDKLPQVATINGTMMLVRVHSDQLEPRFVYHYLQGEKFQSLIQERVSGSSVPHIFQRDMVGLKMEIPPLPEQKKIAEILSGIDRQIEENKCKQISAKRFRNAFLEEYFSCGFLKAENSLDSSWTLYALVDLLEDEKKSIRSGPFGSALLKSELTESGFPFLGIDNVQTEKFIDKYKRFVGEDKFAELQRYEVFHGDVIITIMGTVGRSCVIPKIKERCLSSKHTWTMTFNKDLVIPEIVCWQLNHFSKIRKHFTESGQGGIMDSISSSTLKSAKIPLPSSIQELKKVSDFYASSLLSEQKLNTKISKLQNIKKGISADLLSGRKRVSV